MALDDRILEQAALWATRAHDPAFEDWDGFTAWLEADPRHGEAYDIIASSVAYAADTLKAAPQIANDDEATPGAPRVTRRRWMGGALAASLAGVLAFGFWQGTATGAYAVETAPGETMQVALGDGDTITLGGGTKILLDHGDPRSATLEKGQALFSIRHDETHPFRLIAGEDELVDLGTIFDVRHDGRETRVAVSEGAVSFNPKGPNVRIDPGKVLTSAEGSAEYVLADIATAQVGEWREGRLTFQSASLATVADDLTRSTGIAFSAAPGAAARRVSGSLLLAPVKEDPRSAGPLLGVAVRQSGNGWVLEAR